MGYDGYLHRGIPLPLQSYYSYYGNRAICKFNVVFMHNIILC